MMKRIVAGLSLSLVLVAFTSLFGETPQISSDKSAPTLTIPVDLCFVRDNSVWLRKAGVSKEELWYSGESILGAAIAPQGDTIAIAGRFPISDGKRLQRRIAILDCKGAKPRFFDAIPEGSCGDPIWSPDGKQLLFTLYQSKVVGSKIEAKTRTAIISRDGSDFRIVPRDRMIPLCWSGDGKSIFMADWPKIYQVVLATNMGTSFDVRAEGFKYLGADSGALSPDGTRMLIHSEVCPPRGDLPSEAEFALLLLDLKTMQLERLSEPGSGMSWPCWLPDGTGFLFQDYSSGRGHRVQQMDLKTHRKALVVDGALCPSLGR